MPDNAVASEAEGGGTPWLSSNLKLRICLRRRARARSRFCSPMPGRCPSPLLILVCALVISWEWGRLVRGATFDLGFFVHAIAVTAAIVLAGAGYAALAVAALAIAAITLIPLYIGPRRTAFRRSACSTSACPPLRCCGCAATSRSASPPCCSSSPSSGRPTPPPTPPGAASAAPSCGRACRPTRHGPASSARCAPAPPPRPFSPSWSRRRRPCGLSSSASAWRSSRRPATLLNRRSSACSISRMRAISSPVTAASWTAWTASSRRPSPPHCWRSPSIRTLRRAPFVRRLDAACRGTAQRHGENRCGRRFPDQRRPAPRAAR